MIPSITFWRYILVLPKSKALLEREVHETKLEKGQWISGGSVVPRMDYFPSCDTAYILPGLVRETLGMATIPETVAGVCEPQNR